MKKRSLLVFLLGIFLLSTNCSSSDDSGDLSLADQVAGSYTGVLTFSSGAVNNNYNLTITRITDTRVQFAPAAGNAAPTGSTFEADLSISTADNTSISFDNVTGQLTPSVGTYSAIANRLTYVLDATTNNIQTFIGSKN